MTERREQRPGRAVDAVQDALAGRLSRREAMRRGAALGLAVPAIAALARPAAGQEEPSGEEIVLGALYNLTGGLASIDNPALEGSELAVEQINERGGLLGRPLALAVENGQTDVTAVTNAAKKLVEEVGVPAVFGLTDTTFVLAAAPVAQDAGVPFLDVGGTAPIITSVGDYVFMLPFGDNVQAAAAAEFAAEQGWETGALLLNEGMDYTKFLAEYFVNRFTEEDINGEIVAQSVYGLGDTDFSAQLTEFKNLDPQPDFLFISAGPDEIGTIVDQARALGLDQPILGGDGYDTPLLVELAGEAADDIYFTTHQGVYGDDPAASEFAEAFREKYGREPDSVFAALGYDAVMLLADAIERAGSVEPEQIREALAATEGFTGATGEISYEDDERIPTKSVAIVEVQDQEPQLLDIVMPEQIPPA